MRTGLNFPLEQVPLLEQPEWVQEVERLGFDDLWSSEAQWMDGFSPLALASQWTPELRLGCACFPVQTRGPATLAMSAAALAQAAPGRFVLGIGASSQPIVEWWNGIPYQKPYQYVRDMARFLKKVFDGEMVNEEFESFSVRFFKLNAAAQPRPPVMIAALREGMLRLAGREADGVLLNMVAPEDLARVVPIVKAENPDAEIAVRVCITPSDDPDAGWEVAKRFACGYFTVPTYRAHQEWLGRGDMLKETNERWAGGDRKGALAALPLEVVRAGWMVGSGEECRAHMQAYADAGADTLIIGYLEDIAKPYEAVRALAPR